MRASLIVLTGSLACHIFQRIDDALPHTDRAVEIRVIGGRGQVPR